MEKTPGIWPPLLKGTVAATAVLAASLLPAWVALPLAVAIGGGVAYFCHLRSAAKPDDTEVAAELAGFVEQSLVGIYCLEADRIVYGNQAMADILAYPRDALSDLPLSRVIHPDDLELVTENVRRRMAGEVDSLRYPFRILRGDGQIRHCEVHSRAARLGGEHRLVGVLIDITDRITVQHELALYARAFEASSEGIVVTDAMGMIVTVNSALESLSGYRRDELVGQPVLSLEHRISGTRLEHIVAAALSSGRWQGEFLALRKNGDVYPTMLSISALRNEHHAVSHYIAIISDLSPIRAAERKLLESEGKFRAFVELSLVGLYVVQDGRLVYANPEIARVLGYDSADQLIGLSVEDMTATEDLPLLRDYHRRRLAGEMESARYTYRARRRDGSLLWVEAHGRVFEYDGRLAVMGIALDVSQRIEAERQSRLAERVFESASEGILITDADSRIVAVNPAFSRITGYSAQQAIGKLSRMLMRQDARAEFNHEMLDHLARDGHWQGEMRDRRLGGEWYPVWMSISAVRDDAGRINSYVGVFTDYTSRKEAETRLHYLANHDGLTGLLNRSGLMSQLEHEISRARNLKQSLAVLFLDLDRFKAINDTLGHGAGDKLLVAATERLRNQVKATDLLGRLGGDEFTLVLENLPNPEMAADVANRVVDAMAQHFFIDGHEMFVTASVGVAVYPGDGHDAASLLKNADVAMYRAKQRGKNTYQFFAKEMNAQAFEHLLLENSLRHALERGEFELHYQPQVATETGEIVGVEALIRWRHPELGLVPPARFIPLAEQNGLIVPIGAWVLQEACRQGREWLDAGYGLRHIAVNLSARQFADDNLLGYISEALSQSGLPPHMLELELTESTVMQQPQDAVRLLLRLQEMGVALSIDDFGTGYSSLVSLKQFPLDNLKIDRGFISGIPHEGDDMVITEAIVAIARKMALKVVAEGVETVEQFDFLRAAGCDLVQGYLLGRPMPASELMMRLSADKVLLPRLDAGWQEIHPPR
ncbi:PAS domain S-box protein [Chitinimonas viridis]|uniref:PAS domain S-box protein n=1 Tax=Chitinimonas viridis TaxID=664880 RepID=A0ABT8BBG2_9NEIS|nr:PAS domain S-box protein [Chitinimonas viridis]MDN3579095.1 PAS domain S-box protein [Chitinimonas viridis]